MKHLFSMLGTLAVCAALFSGCTTVESTQKFNRMNLAASPNDRAVCQTYVEIPAVCLFGIPIFVGSPEGDGKTTMFRSNLTTENVVYLLTKECKRLKASRIINVQVSRTEVNIFFHFITRQAIQASGTGVRRGAPQGQGQAPEPTVE